MAISVATAVVGMLEYGPLNGVADYDAVVGTVELWKNLKKGVPSTSDERLAI